MSERRRKRHGRIRRWLVRPLFWGLALAALLLLACYLVLESRQLEEHLAGLLERRASELLDRPVSVGGLSFELLPLSAELDDLVVGGRTADEEPLAVVRHAAIDAQLFWRDGLRLELAAVQLDEPRVNLIFDPEGGSNLAGLTARARSRGTRRGSFQFALEELTIHRGELFVDYQRLPLDLTARGLAGHFWGTEEPQFEAEVRELELTLPRALPFVGAATVRGRLDGRTLELLHARIAGPRLTLATTGRFSFGADRQGALEVAVETGSEFLRELGYVRDQMEGDLGIGGTVSWDAESWALQGAVVSRSLRVMDFPLRRVQGVINGERQRVELEIQDAEYAGGRLTGYARVDLEPGEPPSVSLDLELDEVDFERLMADRGWPVAGVAAAVSGPFSYGFDWSEPDRGKGWAALRVSGREAAGVAFSGDVPLLIEEGVFRTTAARLDSESHSIEAEGAYALDSRSGEFSFDVRTERVERLLPLLRFGGEEGDLWRPSAGNGSLKGSLMLSPSQTRVALRLDLAEVRAPGATADQVRGFMSIGGEGIDAMRLELLRADAGLIVTGSLPFEAPKPPVAAAVPFSLILDAAGWPIEEARAWLPFDLPVTGPAFGALRLGGSLEALVGSAEFTIRSGSLLQVPVSEIGAVLDFDPEAVRFRDLSATAAAGTVSATGSWNAVSDELALEVASGKLRFSREPFASWWSGELEGTGELEGFVAGTLTSPWLSGRLDAVGLRLGERVLGDRGVAGLELSWREGRVAALGSVLGLVEVSGGGRFDEQLLDLDLVVEGPDLRALAELFGAGAGIDFSGSGAGRLQVSGRTAVREPWRAGLVLERLDLEYAGRRLSAEQPVELQMTPNGVAIDSLYLVEAASGNDVFVFGSIALDEGGKVDLRLQSSVDPVLVAPLVPGLELSGGRFDLLAVVGGTPSAPRINGQGEFSGTRVALGGVPPLTNARGLVLFYPGRVVLDSVAGDLGGGRVRIGGAVELPRADKELSYNLQIRGQRVTMRYPEGWELRGDGELTVASLEQGRQVRGAVTLDRAAYLRRVEVGLTQLLQSLFQRQRQEVESTDEELASTQLNLAISGPGALRVRNNVANVSGSIDLALRGSLASPVLFGRVELESGGTLQIGGSDYTVERGALTFANPYRMEPVIDLAARTRRRDYDLALTLTGTPERLSTSLSSDPPLADLDVLGLLATGETTAASGPAQGAEAFLYGQAASLVTERVNRLFDLDRFRIDPLTGSSGSLSSARVTLGKQLSRDLLATYSYDPSLTEQQILQIEWTVARGLTLVLTQNGDGTYAVDSRWEKSF